MSVTDEYLRNNAAYAERFSGPLPLPPARHVAIVAYMDAQLNVYGILGRAEGDEQCPAAVPHRRHRRHRPRQHPAYAERDRARRHRCI